MLKTVEVKVDESGNILIPSSLCDQLRLAPGMTLVVERGENGGLRLRAQPEAPALVQKEGVLVARTVPLEDLSDATERSRQQRLQQLLDRVRR